MDEKSDRPSAPAAAERLRRLSPLGPSRPRPPAPNPEEWLPREHTEAEPVQIPKWKKALFWILRGGSIVGAPAAAAAASPEMAHVRVIDTQAEKTGPTVRTDAAGTSLATSILFLQPAFSEAQAQAIAEEAIAAHAPAAAPAERSEFQHLVSEAFTKLREQSLEMGKDLAKEMTKEAVKVYVLARVARVVIEKLRKAPGNRIAAGAADLIEKVAKIEAEKPAAAASEESVMAGTGCTAEQARSALCMAGFQMHNGLWVPLGSGADSGAATSP